MGQVSYALCAITSIVCFVLLLRGYFRNRTRLLLWSSLCFFCFAIQNGLLFIDLVLMPQIDLSLWRTGAGLIGPAILLCGLIWERQ
ncbi:MAG: DUF5985 family protein [Terriglobales bacterium]